MRSGPRHPGQVSMLRPGADAPRHRPMRCVASGLVPEAIGHPPIACVQPACSRPRGGRLQTRCVFGQEHQAQRAVRRWVARCCASEGPAGRQADRSCPRCGCRARSRRPTPRPPRTPSLRGHDGARVNLARPRRGNGRPPPRRGGTGVLRRYARHRCVATMGDLSGQDGAMATCGTAADPPGARRKGAGCAPQGRRCAPRG